MHADNNKGKTMFDFEKLTADVKDPDFLNKDIEIDGQTIEVQLLYNKDGNPRGFYLYVKPVTINHYETYSTRTYVGWSGVRAFVSPKPITRVSNKAKRDAQAGITAEYIKGMIMEVI